jgi:hypothetical protein
MTEAKRASIERLRASGHFVSMGRRGGLKTKARMLAKDPNYFERIGLLGGEALIAKYGRDHFSQIAKLRGKHAVTENRGRE